MACYVVTFIIKKCDNDHILNSDSFASLWAFSFWEKEEELGWLSI